jgi:hypothetical protein
MDIVDFQRILWSFADEPTDIDVRIGRLVAQVRDDLIDVTLEYSEDFDRTLNVIEHGTRYSARTWLINRIAKLPQLADRILSVTDSASKGTAAYPFVTPAAVYTPDLSDDPQSATDKHTADAVDTLLGKVSRPLPGATSVMYLTSDAGEGKTTLIYRAARLQAERFKSRKSPTLLVPIPLSGRAFLTFDDAVIAALVNKLRFNYLYFDAFVELVKLGALVPAFDGYEEMLVEGSKGEAVSALGNLVQTLDSSGTVVVAARKAFFEYISFKTQARLLDAIGDRSASFSRLALERWDKSKFCEYGALRGANNASDLHRLFEQRFGADHPLLTRAVLVRRLFDVADREDNSSSLAAMLAANPHDYLYSFVDAIVTREANEKWLSRVSGDVLEPLMTVEEHHQLLSLIAQEMWQTSTTSLRYDVVDTIVEIFSESAKKSAAVTRQIKERIRQHSLLASENPRGGALAFDHEDFHNFYLGEWLGHSIARGSRVDVQAMLSVGIVPKLATEQAVQHLARLGRSFEDALDVISAVTSQETGFSFCKENGGAVTVGIIESLDANHDPVKLDGMYFSEGIFAGRSLRNVSFVKCLFQPTALGMRSLADISFTECEFERIELQKGASLKGCTFTTCKIDSVLWTHSDEHIFDPSGIVAGLVAAGAVVVEEESQQSSLLAPVSNDPRFDLFERFLKSFLRRTHIDEELIRLRLGKGGSPMFFAEVLPGLLSSGILERAQWKGRGVQERYRLSVPLSEIQRALTQARGNFDSLLQILRTK